MSRLKNVESPITEGYIKGYEDCLKAMNELVDTSIKFNDNGTSRGYINALNSIITGLYSGKHMLDELKNMFNEQMESVPDMFCDCEECAGYDEPGEIKYVPVGSGKILIIHKGNRR